MSANISQEVCTGVGNLAGPGRPHSQCRRASPPKHPRGAPATARPSPLGWGRGQTHLQKHSGPHGHVGRAGGSPRTAAGLLTRDLFRGLYGFVRGCWAMLSQVPCAKEEGVSSCRSSEAALGPALPGAGQRGFTKLISTDFPSPILYKSEKQGDKKTSFMCPSFLRLKM